jgi:predicted metal-dependent phosphotriesterase family hydrolase
MPRRLGYGRASTMHTVLGPVETAELDFTLCHEHVGANAAGLRHTYPECIDRDGLYLNNR